MSLLKAGFCGDYCGKCENYPEHCKGCNPVVHSSCEFIKCCMEHGVAHCGFCDDFPCDKISNFVPDDSPCSEKGYHLKNLEDRIRMGTKQWVKLQENLWGK